MLPRGLKVISTVSEMKIMTFGLPKTVSNVFIPHLGCLHDIYIFSLRKKPKNSCCFVHFPRYWEKITRCRMRTLGTVLESSDIIFFRCKKILTIRTHPEELLVTESSTQKWRFGQFSEKMAGVQKFDKLTSHFCFGESFDGSKHISILRTHPEELLVRNFDHQMIKIQKKSRKLWKLECW